MFIGLDVGGTHTDVVLMNQHELVASTKVVTNHKNLLESIQTGLKEVLHGINPQDIQRINLSTTLSTNAIIENKLEPVGVLVSAGPGIHPENYNIGDYYCVIDGFIDHRGTEIHPIATTQLDQAITSCKESGVNVYAAVTKFSPRNPTHENNIRDSLGNQADYVTIGHQLSGQLNFPRRIATAYYNSAVWRLYNTFVDAIEQTMKSFGIYAPLHILKADGGTMPLSMSRRFPVESILSGPAASIMGIIALCNICEDTIILDIGGTTTDIAIFAGGIPLVEPQGISMNSHRTLVRALQTKSVGIGGDSAIHLSGNEVTVGPVRFGPAMANGGKYPTLLDACNVKQIAAHGDVHASLTGISELAEASHMSPDVVAARAIHYAAGKIRREVESLLHEISSRPVYTIHELLEGTSIVPEKLYVMGGPAQAFSGTLADEFGYEVIVPENYAVANAIGAALTRNTTKIELFADTEKKTLLIPTLNIQERISGRYSLDDAKRDAVRYLKEHLVHIGVDGCDEFIEIIEAEAFNMVSSFYTTGKNIRVTCQVKPGIEKKQ